MRSSWRKGCEKLERLMEGATEKIGNIDGKVKRWNEIGKQSRKISKETVEICQKTRAQRTAMIEFTSEIQRAVESGFVHKADSLDGEAITVDVRNSRMSIFNTIKELTSGDKVREAMAIASGLTDVAKNCIEKSRELSRLMDDGIDELPHFLRSAIKKSDEADERELDRCEVSREGGNVKNVSDLLRGIENDVKDIQACISDVNNLKLKTAFKVGLQAFVQLHNKAKQTGMLFDYIEQFANDVHVVTHTFSRGTQLTSSNPVTTIREFTKRMMNIIRSNEIIKIVSESVAKLLNVLVQLFEITAQRISKLWSSIAFAKDCMQDCIVHIRHAKEVCTKAIATTVHLRDTSRSLSNKLQAASSFDFKAMRSLIQDGEISEAINMASRVDDEIMDCTTAIICMIRRVNDGYNTLPSLLISDVDRSVAGTFEHDELRQIDDDIAELESCSRSLEISDFRSAPTCGVRGFTDVSDKSGECMNRLMMLQKFANTCETTVTSFLLVWDLESATEKIDEMCRIIHIGEFMKKIADQIQLLLKAITKYMKTAFKKFTLTNLKSSEGEKKTNGKIKSSIINTFQGF